MPGYIKLYRDTQENWVWKEKPFSKGQAWVDIIFRCNHKCEKISHYSGLMWVLRGQFVYSNYKLAEAWGWSEASVRRFIKLLVDDGMLTAKSLGQRTLFEVINYCVYQSLEQSEIQETSDVQKTHKRRNRDAQKTPNNNDNNDNNEKKNIYISVQHLSMTQEEYDKLVNEYGKSFVDNKIEYAKNYAKLKNYKSLYLTLNNWLKSDKARNVTPTPTPTPKGSAYEKAKAEADRRLREEGII